jgi:hypothetical protein
MFIDRRGDAKRPPSGGPCTLGHLIIPSKSDPPESTVLDSIDMALLTEGEALLAEGDLAPSRGL